MLNNTTHSIAQPRRQERLFDVAPKYKIECAGQARVAFGGAAEEIVCSALGLNRIAIDGSCAVCFDAELNGQYFEIKSTKASSGKLVAYDWRLAKEKEFKNLTYAILLHKITGARDNILERMLLTAEILLCPGSLIREVAELLPLSIPKPHENKRHGYTREGYKDGYRNVPISTLTKHVKYSVRIGVKVYGIDASIPVHIA